MFDITRPFYSSFAPQGRFFTANGRRPPASPTMPAGNVIPWTTNGNATAAATGFNRSALRTIAVPIERYLFAGRGSFEFTEGHGAFFEGTYASSNSTSKLEPFPLGAEDIYPAVGRPDAGRVRLVDGVLTRNPARARRSVQHRR